MLGEGWRRFNLFLVIIGSIISEADRESDKGML
jgi:hypothetical protein